MTNSVTYSTFVLTLLLMVGLFFFIRASTKDRIERFETLLSESPDVAKSALQRYFEQRAYQVVGVPEERKDNQLELRGWVRPSPFLAVFLSFLAAVGALCFALVLASLWPAYGAGFLLLLLLAPLAGRFYWIRANREETVQLVVEPAEPDVSQSKITVTAHRDELAVLKQALTQQQV